MVAFISDNHYIINRRFIIGKMDSNKPRCGVSVSDILAFVSILLSIGALFISIKLLWVQKGQYESQRKENQPVFDIITYFEKVGDDTLPDTEILTIRNIGREALAIGLIQCETLIQLDDWYQQDRQTCYIPIIDYFASHADPPGLIGEVITDITEGNRLEYNRFRKECEENGKGLNRYTCQLIHFIKISYTDIYDVDHLVIFENGRKCSREYYENIVKKSREDFPGRYFKMSFLTFDDIKECVNSR